MSTSYNVFITYARDDQERVKPWVEELKRGEVSVFFDTESISGGDGWLEKIAEAIGGVKVLMYFASQKCVASYFAGKELTLALEKKKVVIPVLLEPVEFKGAIELGLAGVHHIEAHEWNVKTAWDVFETSLKQAGVTWRRPTGFVPGVRRSPKDIGPEPGNVRVKRPSAVSSETRSPADGRKSWGWLIRTMVVLAAACVWFWSDVSARVGILADHVKLLLHPEPPPLHAGSLEKEAERLAEQFFLSANSDPLGPLAYVADTLNYCGNQGWNRQQVEDDLKAVAELRPYQRYDITSPAKAQDLGGDEITCFVSVGYDYGNDVVRKRTTYDNRLVFRHDPKLEKLEIIEVSPRTETLKQTDKPVFLGEGQKRAAEDFVQKCVFAGGSSSGFTPEQIGELYVDEPVDDGIKTNREKIIDENRKYADRWPTRVYTITEKPQVRHGLGTELVEVHVGIKFKASHVADLPGQPPRTQEGIVKASYLIQFDDEGRPRIHTHAQLK